MSPEEIQKLQDQVKGLTTNGQALSQQLHELTDSAVALRTNLLLMQGHYSDASNKNKTLSQLNQVLETQGVALNAEITALKAEVAELKARNEVVVEPPLESPPLELVESPQ